MTTSTLYVKSGCPHCTAAKKLLGNIPEKLRSQVAVNEIKFDNHVSGVTRVPTLVTQDGKYHVGSDVFKYLKKWRKDYEPPHTETFASVRDFVDRMTTRRIISCLFVVALILGAWYLLKHRRGVGTYFKDVTDVEIPVTEMAGAGGIERFSGPPDVSYGLQRFSGPPKPSYGLQRFIKTPAPPFLDGLKLS